MASSGTKKDEDFRRRRLSLTDHQANAADLEKLSVNSKSPAGAARPRRLSMSPEMGAKSKDVPFPIEGVGTFSCHGVEPGNRQGETHAKINQDRGCICYPYGPNGNYALFCVFDGHGANGDKVSHFVMQNVSEKLGDKLEKGAADQEGKHLTETFVEVDNLLKKDKGIDAELSGTTAVVVLYKFLDGTKGKLWAANAGDSRAVLRFKGAQKCEDITIDQKPNTPAEQKRIEKAGGYVSPPEEEWGGPARVWLDSQMTLPGLAMARSIGDHLVSSVGVVAEPEITTFDIDTSKHDFIVMASDGVWEFIESDDACKIVEKARSSQKSENATHEVTKLIETAAAKWRQEEGDYRDDITAICVKLGAIHNKWTGDSLPA